MGSFRLSNGDQCLIFVWSVDDLFCDRLINLAQKSPTLFAAPAESMANFPGQFCETPLDDVVQVGQLGLDPLNKAIFNRSLNVAAHKRIFRIFQQQLHQMFQNARAATFHRVSIFVHSSGVGLMEQQVLLIVGQAGQCGVYPFSQVFHWQPADRDLTNAADTPAWVNSFLKMSHLQRRARPLGELTVQIPFVVPVSCHHKQWPFLFMSLFPQLFDHPQCQRVSPVSVVQKQYDRDLWGFGRREILLRAVQKEPQCIQELIDGFLFRLLLRDENRFLGFCSSGKLLLVAFPEFPQVLEPSGNVRQRADNRDHSDSRHKNAESFPEPVSVDSSDISLDDGVDSVRHQVWQSVAEGFPGIRRRELLNDFGRGVLWQRCRFIEFQPQPQKGNFRSRALVKDRVDSFFCGFVDNEVRPVSAGKTF